ncbi:hypothetical protein GCM10010289_84580 [Streptomyces violascens]|nr:hypothetical protein GCM10010289_84580 [Streptomyces violascens]
MPTNSDDQQFPPAALAILRFMSSMGRTDGVRLPPGFELAPGGRQYRNVAELENAGLAPSVRTVDAHLPALRNGTLRRP